MCDCLPGCSLNLIKLTPDDGSVQSSLFFVYALISVFFRACPAKQVDVGTKEDLDNT